MDYAAAVLSTLAQIHQRGVVHCDIKPENTIVTRDGRVFLIDFGVAAEVGEHKPPSSAFSPMFCSPNAMRGGSVSVTDDLTALGFSLLRYGTSLVTFWLEVTQIQCSVWHTSVGDTEKP